MIAPVMVLGLLAGPVAAKPPLREVAEIDNAVFEVAVADKISKECPSISPRKIKGGFFLMRLKDRANDLGYSDAEIDAYRKSDAEKARMKAKGAFFFAAKGVDTSDPQSYCALGVAEIQKSSRIGSLLKAK
ncbi:MAG: DUF5333 domain-containing protein [Sulfitobacter sp.]